MEAFFDIYGNIEDYPENSTVLESAIFIANVETLLNQKNKLEMQVLKVNIKNFFKDLFGNQVPPVLYSLCTYKKSMYDDLFKEPDKNINLEHYIEIHFKEIYKMEHSLEDKYSYLKNIVDYFKDRNVIPKEALKYFRLILIKCYHSEVLDYLKISCIWGLPLATLFYCINLINIHMFIFAISILLTIFFFISTTQKLKDHRKYIKYTNIFCLLFLISFSIMALADVCNIKGEPINGIITGVSQKNILGLYTVTIETTVVKDNSEDNIEHKYIETFFTEEQYKYNQEFNGYKAFVPYLLTT